ncbi:MAG TPA: DUF309 domain-containing protein [bacterium]|nr:DUF309 domain-containing protein [bacterium]
MSYVRLKHALSAIALKSLDTPATPLAVTAMAAYVRRDNAGGAVPIDLLARDAGAGPDAVGRALLDTRLFTGDGNVVALAAPYRAHAAYFRRQVTRLTRALRLATEPPPPGMPIEVHRGAALFNAGLCFEAHEYWEDVWRASRPPERAFYHGLVQAAAGCYHAEKGNAHGAAVLLSKARAKLEAYAPRYLGLDVAALLAALGAVRPGRSPQDAAAGAGTVLQPAQPSR